MAEPRVDIEQLKKPLTLRNGVVIPNRLVKVCSLSSLRYTQGLTRLTGRLPWWKA